MDKNQRNQNTGEPLKDYLAELRRLSRYCNFQAFLDEAIWDKFVCGMINSSICKRLLTEDNLTLDTAIKLAISLEFSNQENEMMNNHGSVYQIYKEKQHCFHCNYESHLANSCKYKNFVCKNCNIKGHLALACRKRRAEPPNTDTKWTSDENRNDDVNFFLRNDETDNLFTDKD